MKVSELGEFGLIERLARVLGDDAAKELIVGIGDDAAAWRSGDQVLLATTDTLVEGVHFLPGLAPWRDVGWKALAVSASDIAAMGGIPSFALVTLALPVDTEAGDVDELYVGMRECGMEYGMAIVGGDVVRAGVVSITVALVGMAQMRAGEPLLLRRDGAQAGDVIAVAGDGYLGDSAAGLRRLRDGAPLDDALVRAHLRPRPPLAMAQEAARLGFTCAIDVSDGLVQDLGHVCKMSGLGADVSAPPMSDELAAAFAGDALALSCMGGEDYLLLLVGSRARVDEMSKGGLPIAEIGVMVEGQGRIRLLDETGKEVAVSTHGWDHLRGE